MLRPGSRKFTRGFLVVTPGVTIRDRLRVLQPNEPDSYYASRELVPNDMLRDLERAKIVVTNDPAFLRRETLPPSKGGRALLAPRMPPASASAVPSTRMEVTTGTAWKPSARRVAISTERRPDGGEHRGQRAEHRPERHDAGDQVCERVDQRSA